MTRFTRRFWTQAGLTSASGVLLVLTAIVPDWIEVVFGVEPDSGDGSFEVALVVVLVACTVSFGVLTWREWRRVRAAADPVQASDRGHV